jgi:outer membrane protein assembly factor BamA
MIAFILAFVLTASGTPPGHRPQAQGPRETAAWAQGPGPLASWPALDQAGPEVIAEVRIHGNHISTDDQIVALAGLTIGAPFTSTTLADIRRRLRDSGKFDDVDVLKRFASIEDPTKISVVIIVNEGPVRLDLPDLPGEPIRVVKRRGLRNLMYMPIFEFEDGYAGTFGARLAFVNVGGPRGRLSFPLTWGGTRRAAIEYDRMFRSGPFSRVEFGAGILQRRNPAFDEIDRRDRAWVRAERSMGHVRTGATFAWHRVQFAEFDDSLRSLTADVAFDTRLDPLLPRNAVYAAAAWERVEGDVGAPIDRLRVDARGYVGVVGQTVLVLRAVREDASRIVPPYLKSLLGGWSSLRGFEAGSYTGDTLVTGSLEVRVPVSSALSIGKLGVSVFVDAGKAYDKGVRFGDAPWHTGVGGSVWVTLAALKVSFSVARGLGVGTRVNFGGGLSF